MPIPEGSDLSTPSPSAPIGSVAEQVLSQAQAAHAQAAQGEKAATPRSAPAKPAAPAASAAEEEPDPADELEAVMAADEVQSKGLSWEDAMRRVPPNVAKLMKSMQSDYTKKTQELAEQRKELQRERESLTKIKFEVPEDVGEYDPFNEQSINKRIEAEVAKRMKQLLEPLQQEAELLKAENDYQSFLAEHPDFKTDVGLRSEVQSLLEANPNLDLQTAYYAAVGRKGRSVAQAPDEGRSARTKAAKEAATAVTLPRRAGPPAKPDSRAVSKMSSAEILELARAMNRN